jgi:hypothetical protein
MKWWDSNETKAFQEESKFLEVCGLPFIGWAMDFLVFGACL